MLSPTVLPNPKLKIIRLSNANILLSATTVYVNVIFVCPCKGNGGNAGHLTLYINKQVRGEVALKTCAGKGAPAANNGKGGEGKTPSSINHDSRLL